MSSSTNFPTPLSITDGHQTSIEEKEINEIVDPLSIISPPQEQDIPLKGVLNTKSYTGFFLWSPDGRLENGRRRRVS